MRFTYHGILLSIFPPNSSVEYSIIKRAKADVERRTCIMQNNTVDKNVKFVRGKVQNKKETRNA